MSDRRISYTLREHELRYATYVGRVVAEHCRRRNVHDYLEGWFDRDDVSIEGACSELACAAILNVYPIFQIDDEDAPDMYLPNGLSVDVKVTARPHPNLMVAKRKDRKPGKFKDVYVLMIGKRPTYEMAGWMYRDEIVQPERWATWPPEPCWAVPEQQTRKPLTLRELSLQTGITLNGGHDDDRPECVSSGISPAFAAGSR